MALYQTTLGLKLPDLLTVEKWSTAQENENSQLLNDAIEEDRSALEQIRQALVAARVPAGAIQIYGYSTAPTGYLLCQGQSVLRSAYPELHKAIGVTYGAVSVLHFNIPNLIGRVIVGVDPSQPEFTPMGKTGGSKTHTLNLNEIPAHSHQDPTTNGIGGTNGPEVAADKFNGFDFIGGTNTGSAGGGLPHNNLQPYAAMQYIIKI